MHTRASADRTSQGDKEALNSIINKYYDELYRFCLYLTGHESDSYDIVQEVFIKFIRYVDSYRYRNLKGYLLTIARNLCHDYFRHRKEEAWSEEIEETGKEDPRLAFVEDSIYFRKALLDIPAQQREVVILRIYEEFKFAEIARRSRSPGRLREIFPVFPSCHNYRLSLSSSMIFLNF